MDLSVILPTAISSLTAFGVAFLAYNQRKVDKREALRREGEMLNLEMSQAGLKLAQVTAKAVHNQKTNGDVQEAMDWAKEVEIKYSDYVRRVRCSGVM